MYSCSVLRVYCNTCNITAACMYFYLSCSLFLHGYQYHYEKVILRLGDMVETGAAMFCTNYSFTLSLCCWPQFSWFQCFFTYFLTSKTLFTTFFSPYYNHIFDWIFEKSLLAHTIINIDFKYCSYLDWKENIYLHAIHHDSVAFHSLSIDQLASTIE